MWIFKPSTPQGLAFHAVKPQPPSHAGAGDFYTNSFIHHTKLEGTRALTWDLDPQANDQTNGTRPKPRANPKQCQNFKPN